MVDRQPLLLHAHHDAGDAGVAIEAQRIGTGQKGYGPVQLCLGDAGFGHPGPFIADHRDRLGDALIGRGHGPHIGRRQIPWQQAGMDPVGQPALCTHLIHQAAFKRSAAQQMVDHKRREEIRVVPFNAALPEHRHRLRRVKFDHRDTAAQHNLCRAGDRRAGGRQIAQQIVDQQAKFRCRDITHRADIKPVPGKHRRVRRDDIIAGQGADRVNRSRAAAAIGVVAKGQTAKRGPGNIVRVLGIRFQAGNHLRPHPVNRLLVEPGLVDRVAQQRQRLIPVLAQEPGRDRHGIATGAISETCRQRLQRAGMGAGFKLSGPFFQQRGHQVDRPAFARRIQRSAAAKPQLERGERDRVVLDQPGGNAAR